MASEAHSRTRPLDLGVSLDLNPPTRTRADTIDPTLAIRWTELERRLLPKPVTCAARNYRAARHTLAALAGGVACIRPIALCLHFTPT